MTVGAPGSRLSTVGGGFRRRPDGSPADGKADVRMLLHDDVVG